MCWVQALGARGRVRVELSAGHVRRAGQDLPCLQRPVPQGAALRHVSPATQPASQPARQTLYRGAVTEAGRCVQGRVQRLLGSGRLRGGGGLPRLQLRHALRQRHQRLRGLRGRGRLRTRLLLRQAAHRRQQPLPQHTRQLSQQPSSVWGSCACGCVQLCTECDAECDGCHGEGPSKCSACKHVDFQGECRAKSAASPLASHAAPSVPSDTDR